MSLSTLERSSIATREHYGNLPLDLRDKLLRRAVRQRNAEFLSMTHHKLSVVEGWGKGIDAAAEQQTQLLKQLGLDGVNHANPDERSALADGLLAKIKELVNSIHQPDDKANPDSK